MIPKKPLPHPDCWESTDEYVDNLLEFATTSAIFQTLCGGVHILDFFTHEPELFQLIVPPDWQKYLLQCGSMTLLDVLMRDDLNSLSDPQPPASLLQYIKDIRRFSLVRSHKTAQEKMPKLSRQVAVGMKPKKVHEVSHFANYVDKLAGDIAAISGEEISHFVDFGSGQNYLGRALASSPYNKHIVAVEGREHNIKGAKELDMHAGIAGKEKVMRNKKLWQQKLDSMRSGEDIDERVLKRAAKPTKETLEKYVVDFRPTRELQATYVPEDGKGFIRYISGQLESGDLSDVMSHLKGNADAEQQESSGPRLMAVSIHSCGNLSHMGIRSLILNANVRAVAIVGCCYNLMTEKLGPQTYKLAGMRPSLQPLNGRVIRESAKQDPQGFPMSERLRKYKEAGIGFNITARMMACQAPHNWGEQDSDDFFTRHFFRAVLQKIFLDKGVISKIRHHPDEQSAEESPFNTSTNPVIIGSLRKSCYKSLHSYVRGAVAKLTTQSDYREYCDVVQEKMGDITDEEIAIYEEIYKPRKRELSAIWSLMAFSAGVVESMIVTDRWLFLKQHSDIVDKCWVETVFDYRESPRNLVVVGMKKRTSHLVRCIAGEEAQ
ncbi:methyltransferase domain-containing protein [Pseudomassariella vexata]|uniref:Methyltransferase domain-domain-containing protein n=1 Tax=Pseudomassariella vexata TaxID=1141098 RepID=A0A1Y2EJ03_9PEZI|nr:methyltransferase domain-containing protein [Pseudomassariella vexata]ORY71216.1 methyltransferase domain-domain-containing protein [Pseudomassariella vexata]